MDFPAVVSGEKVEEVAEERDGRRRREVRE